MRWLRQLERRLQPYAVPNVTIVLIIGQVLMFMMAFNVEHSPSLEGGVRYGDPMQLSFGLIPEKVFSGEAWRVFSFLFLPPRTNAIFAFFFWYIFYLMGTALEQNWGALRYNVFLLIGFLSTIGVGLLGPLTAPALFDPRLSVSNGFVQGTVFLAFAYLYPDFELRLFFILPVKIKWLALITWIGYFLAMVWGTGVQRLVVASSVVNFFVFFGSDLWLRVRAGKKRMKRQAQDFKRRTIPLHRCAVCGIDNKSHPEMDFRYCSKCGGAAAYCTEHIRDHEHKTKDA